MKRIFYIIFLLMLTMPMTAQSGKKAFVVGFYNVENLFDTYDDPAKNDAEFLPDGANQWTEVKYQKKLHNIASVIAAMAETNGRFHTILGLAEVENRLVLEDLVSQPEIAGVNYQIVHHDSPDSRGIDVAMLYNPTNFSFLDSEAIPFTFDSEIEFSMDKAAQARFKTRDVLMVHGLLDGEECAVYVAHLPSRIGGKGMDLRARGAEIIYNHATKMMQEHPGIKIVVMGDMNDNPTDESMVTYMRGKEKISEVGEGDFFSPFLSMLKAGYGSLAYQGTWNIYDIILVNEALVNPASGTLHIRPTGKNDPDGKKAKKGKQVNYGVVYRQDWMIQQSGQYKGTPFRTFSNGSFIGGYSDHLPTYIVLEK